MRVARDTSPNGYDDDDDYGGNMLPIHINTLQRITWEGRRTEKSQQDCESQGLIEHTAIVYTANENEMMVFLFLFDA